MTFSTAVCAAFIGCLCAGIVWWLVCSIIEGL